MRSRWGVVPYCFAKEQRDFYVARGLCACGAQPTPGYKTCEPCRIGNAQRRDKHASKKKAQGK